VVKDAHIDSRKTRVIANLWCRNNHPAGTLRQPPVSLNKKPVEDPKAVPTYLVAAEKLIAKIEMEHGACIGAAEAAKAAAAADSAGPSATETAEAETTDVFAAMIRLRDLRKIADEANVAALAAEKAKDAAEAEVVALERALDPKRRRTDEPPSEVEEPEQVANDWDLADHRREMTRVMNHRGIEIGSNDSERSLRTGRDGYLHHTRTGLVGAVAYWALGSMALAVVMIVALIVHLKLVDKVREALPTKGPA